MANQVFQLNLIPEGKEPIAKASQYDDGRVIQYVIYQGATVYDPPTGTTIEVHGMKADNKAFIYDAENIVKLEGNVITLITNKQITAVPGDTVIQFKLMNGGVELATLNTVLRVQPDPAAVGDISESELPTIVTRATEQMVRAEQAATRASASEASASTSETNAKASETAAKTSETNAKASETVAKASETSAVNSASAAASSEANAKDSEDAAVAAAKRAGDWAVGPSGESGTPSDTNNAEYWARMAQMAAGGGVSSFNGRNGYVEPQTGDYTPDMVGLFYEYYFDTEEDMRQAVADGNVEDGAIIFVGE